MAGVKLELERLGINVADDLIVSTNLKFNLSGLIAIDADYRVRDNLAAIAATLEAMRAIERHGGARILERSFTWWSPLVAVERLRAQVVRLPARV